MRDIAKEMASPRCLNTAWLGLVDYPSALELQESLLGRRQRDEIGDTLLLLEHPHVFTLGRGADARFLLNPGAIPVHRVSRGGQVTYHGPGQLIGYPIIKLEAGDRDVIQYLRRLEQTLINALAMIGLRAHRRDGFTGVWIGEKKIASLGVGFRRWVSLHGFALNVTTELSFFDAIVPCGIAGCRMTSIAAEGIGTAATRSFARIVEQKFASVFGYHQVAALSPGDLLCGTEAERAGQGTHHRNPG